MNAFAPSKKRLSPLLTIFLTVFIDLLGFGIVIPLLPIYSVKYGASEATLGLLFASFSGMQFFFAPMWGRISDKIGRRPVLIGGLVGTAIAYVIFGFAQSLEWLFVSRILAGFFGANISTATAYIADVTTEENRSKGMGLVGAAFGLGFTIGPLLGGFLTTHSEGLPGFAAAGFSLAAAAFGYFNLVEPAVKRDEMSRVFGLDTVREAFRNARIGWLLVLYYLSLFAWSGFEAMFIRFGLAKFPEVFHLTTPIEKATVEDILNVAPIAGLYLFGVGIVSAIIQGGLIRRLIPKFGETRLIIPGPLILGISFLFIAFATHWSWVIFGCILMPFGFGINTPSLTGLLSRASPVEKQGAYLGLGQSIASLARMTGPVFAGVVFSHLGPSSPFWIGACVLLLSTTLAIRYRSRFGATFNQPAKKS